MEDIKGTKQKQAEFYLCVWVSKEDLINSEILTEKEIEGLTEEEMESIATDLGDYLIGDEYSDGVDSALIRFKRLKEKKNNKLNNK